MTPPERGAVVAIVGSDGSGKTTLGSALVDHFGASEEVFFEHLGGPPESWVTHVPRFIVRAARKTLKIIRGFTDSAAPRDYPHLDGILDLLVVCDRLVLARRCEKRALLGALVIADRYPCVHPGAANGPRMRTGDGIFLDQLARAERYLYHLMPLPALVVRISVPVEEAVRRNAGRREPKEDDVVRASHHAASLVRFPDSVQEITIDGLQPIKDSLAFVEETIREVRSPMAMALLMDGWQ